MDKTKAGKEKKRVETVMKQEPKIPQKQQENRRKDKLKEELRVKMGDSRTQGSKLQKREEAGQREEARQDDEEGRKHLKTGEERASEANTEMNYVMYLISMNHHPLAWPKLVHLMET